MSSAFASVGHISPCAVSHDAVAQTKKRQMDGEFSPVCRLVLKKRRVSYKSKAFRAYIGECVAIIKGSGASHCTTLNGNSGEATNADDVETKKEINDANKRNHKSAALRVHQKATSSPRSDPDDRAERPLGKSRTPKLTPEQRASNLAENKRILAERQVNNDAKRLAESRDEKLHASNEEFLNSLPKPAPTPYVPETFNVPVPKTSVEPGAADTPKEIRKKLDYTLTTTKIYMEVEEELLTPTEREDHSARRWTVAGVIAAAALWFIGGVPLTLVGFGASVTLYSLYLVVSFIWWTLSVIYHWLFGEESAPEDDEYDGVTVRELYTRADPDDRKFKPLKKYGFNCVREAQVCFEAVRKLEHAHPGMRPTAYTVNTFVYTLANTYPDLTNEVAYDTATYYHQVLLAREAVLKTSTGRLVRVPEKL